MDLIVEGKGLFIGKHQGRICVSRQQKTLQEMPLIHLKQIVVVDSGIGISSDVVRVCSEEGIPIHFISKRGSTLAGLYATGLNATILTRRAQLLAYTTPVGVVVSKAFVAGKIANQTNLLRYFAKSRTEEMPELCREIDLVLGELRDAQQAITDLAQTSMQDIREQLLSIEGRAAQRYWHIVKSVLPATVQWPGRETRGAKDLFNALLNYGYGVLYAQVEQALLLAGLDPYAGFLHTDRPGKPSLVLDVIEEFRQCVVDRTIIGLLNKRVPLEQDEEQLLTLDTRHKVAERILQQHDGCSMVVCNTVQRAQETYLQLWEAIEQQPFDIELRLLHSRFTDADRKAQGKELNDLLGKEQWKDGVYQREKGIIVVATQVVEVGLDISVQTLHSELAPANSLIQRAGRCARFERQQGRVIVYPLCPMEEGKPASTLPYAADLCQATWDAMEQFDGHVMGFREEQQLIDSVHTPGDLALLDRYEAHRDDLQRDITTMLQTSERENSSELIRDVNQVQLVIHDNPEVDMKVRPWRWQSFGLHPSALMGKHWDALRERQNTCDLAWLCRSAQKKQEQQPEDEDDHRLPIIYEWPPITAPAEIPGALLLAMPHQVVTYDKNLGLVFLDGRIALPEVWRRHLEAQTYQSPLLPPKFGREDDSGPTRMQSYRQHIGGLADAYHYAIRHELAYAMKHLESLMRLEAGTIDHAMQLAIATHDLGKLDAQWQRWARAWQRLLHEKGQWSRAYQERGSSFFFAKTDYDYRSNEQREWQKELSVKRPKHACESVMAGRRLIMHSLGVNSAESPNYPVVRAVCSAVAHHHTPTAHEYGATKISTAACASVEDAFEVVRRGSGWSYDLDRLSLTFEKGDLCPVNASQGRLTQPDIASGPEKLLETWLAFLIVRALRLADQRADLYAV